MDVSYCDNCDEVIKDYEERHYHIFTEALTNEELETLQKEITNKLQNKAETTDFSDLKHVRRKELCTKCHNILLHFFNLSFTESRYMKEQLAQCGQGYLTQYYEEIIKKGDNE